MKRLAGWWGVGVCILVAAQAGAADDPQKPTIEQYSVAFSVVVKQRDTAQAAVNQMGIDTSLKIAELEAQIAALRKQIAESSKPKTAPVCVPE